MRPRDHNILARELKQQLLPSRKSRRRVDVENHRDLGMLQLDALSVHGVSPKQEFLSLGRKFVTGMPRSMTMQRHDFDAVNDLLGVAKRTPLAGLDVWRCDALGTLEELLRFLRRFRSDLRRQPKIAFCLRYVDLGIWKNAIS